MDQQKTMHNLHAWFQQCGRDLPWRRTIDPYAILVSEIMLQQTQVKTVLRYFSHWMEKFPNIQVLATASEDAVLKIWQGLGYYSRARNLLRAAQILAQLITFPRTSTELKRLPGIGEYTANAVVAFAFDACVPVVDTNIARVLSRFFEYSKPVHTFTGTRALREMAIALLPTKGGGRLHNAALMELGALVCKPRQPLCSQCPIRLGCRTTQQLGTSQHLVGSRSAQHSRALLRKIEDCRAFCCDGVSIWLVRSTERWWVGLWILPALKVLPLNPCDYMMQFAVTRYQIKMRIWRYMMVKSDERLHKIALRNLEQIAIPTPHRRGIATMVEIFHTRRT